MNDEPIIILGVTLVAAIILAITFAVGHGIDRNRCFSMARNYEAEVKEYAWISDYCFVEMPDGAVVNLDNYRDTNVID